MPGRELPATDSAAPTVEWWLIASQTCNLYNSDFEKIPVIELVGAKHIDSLGSAYVKGDHPRILHVEAASEGSSILLELDLLMRRWVPRKLLAELPAPSFRLRDAPIIGVSADSATRWNDNFSGWIARSYTRITLPDQFNQAIRASKIDKAIEKKLLKRDKDLYGIYFAIDYDKDESWGGALGEMPPPYLLGIMLVTEEHADAELMRLEFIKSLFDDQITDSQVGNAKITRAELARRHGIRIVAADVTAKSVAEVTLHELRGLVRFSIVDHLSDSSMAAKL